MRAVVWSETALADLDGIIDYIAPRNPSAALRVIDRIEQVGNNLGTIPTGRAGRVAGTYEKLVPGLPYILAYAVQSLPNGEESIVILRAITAPATGLQASGQNSAAGEASLFVCSIRRVPGTARFVEQRPHTEAERNCYYEQQA